MRSHTSGDQLGQLGHTTYKGAETGGMKWLSRVIQLVRDTEFQVFFHVSPPCCSVTKLCPILHNPMACSTPGFSVLHCLPKFTQIPVHWVGDAIQPSHPLPSPSSFPFKLSQLQGLFQWVTFFASGGQSIGVSVLASVFLMNIQSWFPLGLTGLISLQSKGLSRVFFNTTVQKHQFFGAQPFYGPTLTSVPNYWKNHSYD